MKLDEIRKRYNISSDNLEDIKSQLKIKIKESHPDNNNEFDKDYISELNNDLTYVEDLIKNSGNKNTLVPMSEVLQTLAEIKKNEGSKEVLDRKLSENIQSRLLITKKNLKVPRIGSGAIAAIITFLWLFPNQIIEHPLFQVYFSDIAFNTEEFVEIITATWLSALVFVVLIWSYSVRIERIEKGIMERLKLESVQNEIFMNFLNSISPSKKFSKSDFVKYLAYGLNEGQKQENSQNKESVKLNFTKFLFYCLDRGLGRRITLHFEPEEEIVQSMADIILLRAKEYEIIKASKSHCLIEYYEIIQDELV